jgi:hypothetical protein
LLVQRHDEETGDQDQGSLQQAPDDRPTDFFWAGSYWVIVGHTGRSTITSGSTYDLYVSVSGDDNNPGTAALPFLTLQRAWNVLVGSVDLNGGNAILHVVARLVTSEADPRRSTLLAITIR